MVGTVLRSELMLMLVLVIASGRAPVAAQSGPSSIAADLKQLEGLRQERQYPLAAAICQRKLRAADAEPELRVRYAVEWIRTLAEQAWQSPPEQGEPYWNDALGVAQRYASDYPHDPRRVLVQVQQGLVYAARGRWRKRQQELLASPEFGEALADLRRATRRVQEIDQQLAGGSRNALHSGLTLEERGALRNNLRQHLAHAYLEMAACFDVGSADRINACSRGLHALRQISEPRSDPSRRWNWHLAQIRAQVLMHRHPVAEQWVDRMLDQNPPLDERWLAEGERARCRLNEGRPAEGLEALQSLPRTGIRASVAAELEYVKLRCLVALWQQATQDPTRDPSWQERAVAQLSHIQELQRDYWFRRAELLVALAVAEGRGGVESGQLLKRAADNHYRRGQWDAAATTYQQAAERAVLAGNEESALEMSRLAAAVQHQQGHRTRAVTEWRTAALRFSSQPRAADTHWMAVLGQAELLRSTSQPAGSRESADATYQDMLAEHLVQWPQSHSAIDAHAWSARWEQRQRRWETAIEHCHSVLRQAPQRVEMLLVLGQCYRDWLDQLRQAGEGTGILARRASDRLSQDSEGLPSETADAERSALELIRAEIEIRYLSPLRAPARARLQRLLDAGQTSAGELASKATDEAWQRSARMLLVECDALAGDWDAAQQAAVALGPLEWPAALRLVGLLEPSLQHDQTRELGRLQSRILQQVRPTIPNSDVDQYPRDRWQARALVRAGQLAEAHSILEPLAHQLPADGAIQEEYAQLLATQGDSAALGQWRRVVRNSRPATARWYRAKYAIAELHYKMGDRNRAAQMIRLLQTLHPDLGGAPTRAQFETLLDRCGS